jgi:phosphatidylserine decarboxylase
VVFLIVWTVCSIPLLLFILFLKYLNMFHKEGYRIIMNTFILVAAIALLAEYKIAVVGLKLLVQLTALILLVLVLQFFRNPKRVTPKNPKHLIAPVDGKVVIVEEVYEKEYFKDQRLQVSIFMSPLNVHVTRYTMSGKVNFSKYHPGKYLVAWHPKSSELNERTTIVLENDTFGEILYRQIAGAVARRIVNYAVEGTQVTQGEDAGFIKFGSRVDLFLPLNTPLDVQVNDVVKGGVQTLAHLP